MAIYGLNLYTVK